MHLTPAELESELAENNNLRLIDVCEPYEFQHGHIRGAVNIPLSGLESGLRAIMPDIKPDDRIVVYCAHGVRSRTAAKSLWNLGYRNVSSLMGGFAGWRESGCESEKTG